MKANSRRRVLISSIAMLLVALVALSTATFAWFTSSTSATASNIGVSTTKSSELKLAKNDLVYVEQLDYGFTGKVLRPTTSATGEAWYKSNAAAKTAATSNGTYAVVDSTEQKTYYFVDMLNIKNFGEATCNGVTITINADIKSDFARLAVVPVATQTEAGKMPSAATNFKANIYAKNANDTWKPYNGTELETNNYTIKAVANGTEIQVGDLAAGAVASYKVFVWFEGEDADCFDLTESLLTAPTIGFTVNGSTAQ